ncbi:MAG: NADH-quinone oxidoreductase subunit NuoB [Patescibacteria group bacterium]
MSTFDKMLLCSLQKGIVTSTIDKQKLEQVGLELKKIIARRFSRSFNIREVDTGSCGACESEIIAANNPIYDISRFGVNFVASPRHADALLVTGPVSLNMVLALQKTYAAMPEPKLVITAGDCAKDGGLFKASYYVKGGVNSVLPVAIHIPGCPPTPLTIIKYLLGLLKSL